MQSYGSASLGSFDRLDKDAAVAAMQSLAGSQIRSAPIAEALARAEKNSALADQIADRLTSIVNRLLGPTPEAARGAENAQNAPDSVIVRQLNDRITGTFTALNRIDAQLGRLAAALG